MKRRGIILVTVLFIVVLVMMMTVSMLSLNQSDLLHGNHYKDRVRALELARGGLNHAAQVLAYDPSSEDPIIYTGDSEHYKIQFDGPQALRSVNNLSNLAAHPVANFRGDQVPSYSADLLCTSRVGKVEVRVRGLLRRGFNVTDSVSTVGKVRLDGDVRLNGILSLDDAQAVGGGITALHSSSGAGDEAITWTGSGNFQMEGESELKTGPASSSSVDSISSNLKTNFPDRISEGTATRPPPRFEVADTVTANSAHPAPDGMTTVAGIQTLGYSNIVDERHVSGPLVVNGDLSLNGGTLYVDGDVDLNGGIHGIGSVFVKGKLSINGGNSVLLTNQSKGAAVFASDDITLTGLDASGYLDSLATAHPTVEAARDNLVASLSEIQAGSTAPSTGANATSLWESVRHLAWDQGNESNYWLSPIPGPDGSHALGSQHFPLPSTIIAIKDSLGPSYDTDVRAQKVVQALEQIHHNFRFNYVKGPAGSQVDPLGNIPGVSPAAFYSSQVIGWDDDLLLASRPANDFDAWTEDQTTENGSRYKDLALDHQWRASGGSTGAVPAHLQELRQTMFRQAATFFEHHPLDFSWLGNSYFQGLIYSEGEVRVDNNFHVVGGLFSGGDVTLTGGSELIYDAEYMTFDGAVGPVYVAAYEEL